MAAPEALAKRGLRRARHDLPEGGALAVPASLIVQTFGKEIAARFGRRSSPAPEEVKPRIAPAISAAEEAELNAALAVLERLGNRRSAALAPNNDDESPYEKVQKRSARRC